MTELLNYDEDAREAVSSVQEIESRHITLREVEFYVEQCPSEPWSIDGDELTKRGMK